MKKVFIWILTIICAVFVQTCTKAIFKAKRMEEQRKEWKHISTNSTEQRAINRMKGTSDIDKKLTILAQEMNKDLPKKLDDITILQKIELHENREVRYCYVILDDELYFSKSAIEEHRKEMVQKVKNTSALNKFKEYGVTMAYSYNNSKGENLMLIKVYPEDYR
ncbi:MAG: hypothetical protein IKB31_06815 [Bacteroidaceae bacterium]|nr:hypothetical protein [Bacteroidaceae bacterium]